MEIIKEKQQVEVEKIIMTREEYNQKLKEARLQGRTTLANEFRNVIVNFEYQLNLGGINILLKRLADKIRDNISYY